MGDSRALLAGEGDIMSDEVGVSSGRSKKVCNITYLIRSGSIGS